MCNLGCELPSRFSPKQELLQGQRLAILKGKLQGRFERKNGLVCRRKVDQSDRFTDNLKIQVRTAIPELRFFRSRENSIRAS